MVKLSVCVYCLRTVSNLGSCGESRCKYDWTFTCLDTCCWLLICILEVKDTHCTNAVEGILGDSALHVRECKTWTVCLFHRREIELDARWVVSPGFWCPPGLCSAGASSFTPHTTVLKKKNNISLSISATPIRVTVALSLVQQMTWKQLSWVKLCTYMIHFCREVPKLRGIYETLFYEATR